MRSKEDAHDYRYFPEPDLVPLRISEKWLDEVRATMPELPAAKRARFIEVYGLREYDAEVLTSTRAMAEYYEIVAEVSQDPKMAANWVIGEGKEITESPLPARHLGELVGMIVKGELSGKLAKEVLPKMIESGEPPAVIVEREGLETDQRFGRARKDCRRSARRQPETGGTIQERQNDGDRIPGGPGDESFARPGESGRGKRTAEIKAVLTKGKHAERRRRRT